MAQQERAIPGLHKRLILDPSCYDFQGINVADDIPTALSMAISALNDASSETGGYFQQYFELDGPIYREQVIYLFGRIVNSLSNLDDDDVTVHCDDPCGWCGSPLGISATGNCNGATITTLCYPWAGLPQVAACGEPGRAATLIHENSIVWGASDTNVYPYLTYNTYNLQSYAQGKALPKYRCAQLN